MKTKAHNTKKKNKKTAPHKTKNKKEEDEENDEEAHESDKHYLFLPRILVKNISKKQHVYTRPFVFCIVL